LNAIMKSKKYILVPLGLAGMALTLYLVLRVAKPAVATPSEFAEGVARHYNPWISQQQASQIASSLASWTQIRNLNMFTSLAIIAQESSFRPWVTGDIGEKGLWQLSDIALAELERVYGIKVDRARVYDIDYNTELGTLYFLYCVKLAKGERREAVARYHRTTEYWEAWDYADAVLSKREEIVRMHEEFIKGG